MRERLMRAFSRFIARERCEAIVAAARSEKGFNLIEITVVIVIMGLLMSIVGVAVNDALKSAKQDTTRVQIKSIENALEVYNLDNGRYPSTSEGLAALIKAPSSSKKPGKQYLKGDSAPLDGWDREFQYYSPGSRGNHDYEVISLGADGENGGEGFDADLASFDAQK